MQSYWDNVVKAGNGESGVSSKQLISLRVNGFESEVAVSGFETLLTILRDELQLTGTKRGCNQGICGACTVMVDGIAVRSCLSLACLQDGAEILTVEGLAEKQALSPIQQAFSDTGAVQCGFCTSGMMIATKALLEENPNPSLEDIRSGLSGNICRCSGYKKIVEAVERVVQHNSGDRELL